MKTISPLTKTFFGSLSIVLFSSLFFLSTPTLSFALLGAGTGAVFFLCLLAVEKWLTSLISLKNLTTFFLSLLMGVLFSNMLVKFFSTLQPSFQQSSPLVIQLMHVGSTLLCTFLSLGILLRSSGKTYIQLPFIKLSSLGSQDRHLIIDKSAFSDNRLLELLQSGIISHHIILPFFVIKEAQNLLEGDEKQKALQNYIRMEENQHNWGLSISSPEISFSGEKCYKEKIRKAAKLFKADVLTSDSHGESLHLPPGSRLITLQHLSHILKPSMKMGELLPLKIQRLGKEPDQGIGYLEDGTMVVVNGAGNFIGQVVKTRVISTKHSSSGRIIFCNLLEGSKEREVQKKQAELIEV